MFKPSVQPENEWDPGCPLDSIWTNSCRNTKPGGEDMMSVFLSRLSSLSNHDATIIEWSTGIPYGSLGSSYIYWISTDRNDMHNGTLVKRPIT